MTTIGLVEAEKGRWVSPDGLKEIADFDGGMVMVTRLWLDKPEFDVRTVHVGSERTAGWMNECLREHIETIRTKTEDLKRRGMAALKREPSS